MSILLIMFQILDCAQTIAAGINCEGNPFLVSLWKHYGLCAVIAPKLVVGIIALVAEYLFNSNRPFPGWMRRAFKIELSVVTVGQILVCLWNVAMAVR